VTGEQLRSPVVVNIALPIGLEGFYSYKVPDGIDAVIGSLVTVSLKKRKVKGVIWDGDSSVTLDPSDERLREIDLVHDCPPINKALRRFTEWVANYYLAPLGLVLKMVLNSPKSFDPAPPTLRRFQVKKDLSVKLTSPRRRVLEYLESNSDKSEDDVLYPSRSGFAKAIGVSKSVIDGLISCGILEEILLSQGSSQQTPMKHDGISLNRDQEAAAKILCDGLLERNFGVFLLEGVTGSGKTEVYLKAIAQALAEGRQALVLLPEVALTAQFIDRCSLQLNVVPHEWHAQVSQKNRTRCWRGVATGEVRLVVGARSAIYLPFDDLGLIIVDEEHDDAFKQTEGVCYHARDMAVLRGKLSNASVILASATPSIETSVNADNKRYRRILLPSRASGNPLPDIEIVNLCHQRLPKGRYISPGVAETLKQTMESGNQGVLFLNRRGYAPMTICHACGFRYQCRHCSIWLVEHREREILLCHYCNYLLPKPKFCHSCKARDSLIACGPGVERIAEEASLLFPEAKQLILSSDNPGNIDQLHGELRKIEKGEVDIIIGTQIVTKGHNFPKLKVAVVVDADLGLSSEDPRAAERTFQTLQQVTGRAGRSKGVSGAKGIIQTRLPEHPLMQAIASGSTQSFYEYEITARRSSGMPPFGRLAALIVSCRNKDTVLSYTKHLAQKAPSSESIEVLGPIEAPIAVLRGCHRFRLLVRSLKTTNIQKYMRDWLGSVEKPDRSINMRIDVDPYHFL